MDNKVRHALVIEDPTKSLAVGASFQISAMYCRPVIEAGAGDLKEWEHFGTILIGLSFYRDSIVRADGSAVLIAPGLALAARHVFNPVLDDLLQLRTGVLAFSIIKGGIVLWRISQIIMTDNDVVILRLDLASDIPIGGLQVATLTTRLPDIGEPIMIAGVRGGSEVDVDGPLPIDVRVGVGEVTAVYPIGRDSVMLPHPCVEVKCLTIGGMSGGPAFDKDGNLLGILTSSFEDDIGPSYLSLWWPLAAWKIETCWPSGIVELPTTLLDMQRKGVLAIIKPEALVAEPAGALSYASWS